MSRIAKSKYIYAEFVMTQDEINELEWGDCDNWAGPLWLSVYFSKRDSRTLVPKQIRWMGGTINLGSRWGVYWLVGAIVGPVGVMVGVLIAVEVLK